MLEELLLIAQQVLKQQQEKRPGLNPLTEVVEYYGRGYNNLIQLVCTKVANNLDEKQLKELRQGNEIQKLTSSGIKYPYFKLKKHGTRLDSSNLSIQTFVWHHLYKALVNQHQPTQFQHKHFELAMKQREVEILADADLNAKTSIENMKLQFIRPLIYIPSLSEINYLKVFIKDPNERQILNWKTGVGIGHSNPAFIEKALALGITPEESPLLISYTHTLNNKKVYLSEVVNVNDLNEAEKLQSEVEELLTLSLKNYKMPSKDFIKVQTRQNSKSVKAARLHARGCLILRNEILLILADGDNKDVCLAPQLTAEDLTLANIKAHSNGYCIIESSNHIANITRFKKVKNEFINLRARPFPFTGLGPSMISPELKREILEHLEISKLSQETLGL